MVSAIAYDRVSRRSKFCNKHAGLNLVSFMGHALQNKGQRQMKTDLKYVDKNDH